MVKTGQKLQLKKMGKSFESDEQPRKASAISGRFQFFRIDESQNRTRTYTGSTVRSVNSNAGK